MLDTKLGLWGFIEYIAGKYLWCPVYADDYMFIRSLWVVGQSKGKDYAQKLVDECVEDAKKSEMNGVAMTVSEGNWLISKDTLLKTEFESVEKPRRHLILWF
jgi:N-acetylglutamate synthase-like GNAT family acetyltransferase